MASSGKTSKLAQLGPRLATFDSARVTAPPKTAAPLYHTPEYRAWRAAVIARSGYRCEAIDNGQRCGKGRASGDRLFADHKHEVRDGGALFDTDNGKCLCGSHHSGKTAQARAARR
jgi:hypothetical protein